MPSNPPLQRDARYARAPELWRSASLRQPCQPVAAVVGSIFQPLRPPARAHGCRSFRGALVRQSCEFMPHTSEGNCEHPRVWVPVLVTLKNLYLCLVRHLFLRFVGAVEPYAQPRYAFGSAGLAASGSPVSFTLGVTSLPTVRRERKPVSRYRCQSKLIQSRGAAYIRVIRHPRK